jgi:hypothetical protein
MNKPRVASMRRSTLFVSAPRSGFSSGRRAPSCFEEVGEGFRWLALVGLAGDDQPVRRHVASRPLWVTTVFAWLVSVTWLTVGWKTDDGNDSWLSSFIFACLVTTVSVTYFARDSRRARDNSESVTGPLTPEQQQAVVRAAESGIPPTDPALRRPALDLARYQLANALQQRAGMIAVLCVAIVLAAGFAVAGPSLWFAITAVLFVVLLVRTLIYPSRQNRRINRLDADWSEPAPSR